MDNSYSDFKVHHSTTEERIEGLLALLTPDPKAVMLWSMEPEKQYSYRQLHEQAINFSGGSFPVSPVAMCRYLNNSKRPSTLESACVVDCRIVRHSDSRNDVDAVYQKTKMGFDIADPIIANAVYLWSSTEAINLPLVRLLGQTNQSANGVARRRYIVYAILRELARQPKKAFCQRDLVNRIDMPLWSIVDALQSLGDRNIIVYESPSQDKDGRRAVGWAKNFLSKKEVSERSADEVYSEIRARHPNFKKKKYLQTVWGFIQASPEQDYEAHAIAKATDMNPGYVTHILSALRSVGLLESRLGKLMRSRIKATETASLLWHGLFEPVGRIAAYLDPDDCRALYEPWRFYESHPEQRAQDLHRFFGLYADHRKHRSSEHAERLKQAVLSLPQEELKATQIKSIIERSIGLKINRQTLATLLYQITAKGQLERTRRGHYRRVAEEKNLTEIETT